MDSKDEKTTEAQTTATTSTETKGEGAKPTIREHVAAARAAKDSAPAPTQSDTAKPADTTEGKGDDKGEAKDDAAPKLYTDAELEEELKTKDLRELDPKRLPAALKTTLAKLQAAEGRKHSALNDKVKELDLKLKQLDDALAKANTGKEAKPTEPEEDENLVLSKEEIQAVLKSKAGQAALAENLRELGYDPTDAREAAESRMFRDAIAAAKSEDVRLQEEPFFDEALEIIKGDERLSKLSQKENITGAEIRYVFLTAANMVAKSRLDKASADIEKTRSELAAEKANLKKAAQEASNRNTPASKAVGGRQPNLASEAKPSIREYVKGIRAGTT